MTWLSTFREYIQNMGDFWTGKTMDRYSIISDTEKIWTLRKKQSFKERKASIVHADIQARILRVQTYQQEKKVTYLCYIKFLIKQKHQFYIEEHIQERLACFKGSDIISDHEVIPDTLTSKGDLLLENEETRNKLMFKYDRLQAVKYADRWWNSHNPDYQAFEVDCTNYISQCLYAGGAPMYGHPKRGSGWWYQQTNWSFSWSVAHAFRWYLSGAKQGLRAQEADKPEQLVPGDVICYDFEGDNHWNHTVIVTDKDAMGMPLVNAHTTNSRHRYWAYEDSPAWTEKTKYKFFKINDDASK